MDIYKYVLIKLMKKINQAKIIDHSEDYRAADTEFIGGNRLNVNDLLKRKKVEKQIEKRTNTVIFFSAVVVFAIVLLIINL